jgi:hypothetical protein
MAYIKDGLQDIKQLVKDRVRQKPNRSSSSFDRPMFVGT